MRLIRDIPGLKVAFIRLAPMMLLVVAQRPRRSDHERLMVHSTQQYVFIGATCRTKARIDYFRE
jgi:hypothetical protein